MGINPGGVTANERTGDNVSGIVRLDYLSDGGQSLDAIAASSSEARRMAPFQVLLPTP